MICALNQILHSSTDLNYFAQTIFLKPKYSLWSFNLSSFGLVCSTIEHTTPCLHGQRWPHPKQPNNFDHEVQRIDRSLDFYYSSSLVFFIFGWNCSKHQMRSSKYLWMLEIRIWLYQIRTFPNGFDKCVNFIFENKINWSHPFMATN